MNSATIHSKSSISEQLLSLSPLAELCFYKALPHADDYGRIKLDPVHWALHVAPGRLTTSSAKRVINELIRQDLATSYQVDGRHYLQFTTWFEHQNYRHDYVLKSRVPNPETRDLEEERTYKQAKDEGITARRPQPTQDQPNLIHVQPVPPVQPVQQPTANGNKSHSSDKSDESRDSAQTAFSLLTLIKGKEKLINQSFFSSEGQIDIAALSRAIKEDKHTLWEIFLSLYPETAHPASSAAKLHFNELAKAGEDVDMLKGAMRYRLYCQQKGITDKIFGVASFLTNAKYKENWINVHNLKPVQGQDFELHATSEGAGYVDAATGEPWNEETWRARYQELAS